MKKEENLLKNSTSTEKENASQQAQLTEKQRFINMVEAQVEFLQNVRKQGKADLFRQAVGKVRADLQYSAWQSYLAHCISYKEYLFLVESIRKKLSWDNLLGIHQYSLWDNLDDEKLVDTMTAEV